MTGPRYRIGIDIGGTFTDLAVVDPASGTSRVFKALSTPSDPLQGILEAVGVACEALGCSARELIGSCSRVVHGTTIGTNAVIQRDGPRMGLLATRGFRDVSEFMKGGRPDTFNLHLERPRPLVPRHRRLGVGGRIDLRGREVEALDEADVRAGRSRLRRRRRRGRRRRLSVVAAQSRARAAHARDPRGRAARRAGRHQFRHPAPDTRMGPHLGHHSERLHAPRPLRLSLRPEGVSARQRARPGAARHPMRRRLRAGRARAPACGPEPGLGSRGGAGRRRPCGLGVPVRARHRHPERRYGRHQLRCLPDPQGAPQPDAAPRDRGHADRLHGRRHRLHRSGRRQHRLDRPGRRVAGGSAQRRLDSRTRLLRSRRRGAHGHGLLRGPGPGRSRRLRRRPHDARRERAPAPSASAWPGPWPCRSWRPPTPFSASPTSRWCAPCRRCRSSAVSTRAA